METIAEQQREWYAFLDTVAPRTNELIIDPKSLALFRERIAPFAVRWKKHVAAEKRAEEERVRHWHKVKSNPQWRDKAADPPNKGWEWDRGYVADLGRAGVIFEIPPKHVPDVIAGVQREIEAVRSKMAKYAESSGEYQGLADYVPVLEQDLVDLRGEFDGLSPSEKTTTWIKAPERCSRKGPSKDVNSFLWFRLIDVDEREIFGCWRPPLRNVPEDPCRRLIPEQGTRKLPPPRDKTEEYERYYVSLASIHDNLLPGCESITKPVWPDGLAQDVWFRFSNGQPAGPDRAFIEAALSRVKADVAQLDKKLDPKASLLARFGMATPAKPSETTAGDETHTKSLVEWAGGERVTLAIVFTDVVGSTALGNEFGDERMNEILKAHFEQGRGLLNEQGGWEVKTIGDSFMAVFHSTDKALDFAIALHSNPGHPRVQVRAGIHVGEVQVRDRDISGDTVNFSKRVVDAAKDAEIWLSDQAKLNIETLRATRHSGLKWEPHDRVPMKGFSNLFTLWSLVSSDTSGPSASGLNGIDVTRGGR